MENHLECRGSSKTYLRAGIEGAKRGEGRLGTAGGEVRKLGCGQIDTDPVGSSSLLSHLY